MSAATLSPVVTRLEHVDGPLRGRATARLGSTATDNAAKTGEASETRSVFGFSDFLDTVNPLQQLPVVGTIYRAVTGDEISQRAHYAGSALYGMALGGPIGMGAMVGIAIAGDVVSDHFSMPDISLADNGEGAGEVETEVVPELAADVAEAPVTDDGFTETPSANASGSPLDLFQWLRPEAAGAGSSIEMVSEPFAPADVNEVASHPSNHLPLSVLEALRQRHMGLLDNEPT